MWLVQSHGRRWPGRPAFSTPRVERRCGQGAGRTGVALPVSSLAGLDAVFGSRRSSPPAGCASGSQLVMLAHGGGEGAGSGARGSYRPPSVSAPPWGHRVPGALPASAPLGIEPGASEADGLGTDRAPAPPPRRPAPCPTGSCGTGGLCDPLGTVHAHGSRRRCQGGPPRSRGSRRPQAHLAPHFAVSLLSLTLEAWRSKFLISVSIVLAKIFGSNIISFIFTRQN